MSLFYVHASARLPVCYGSRAFLATKLGNMHTLLGSRSVEALRILLLRARCLLLREALTGAWSRVALTRGRRRVALGGSRGLVALRHLGTHRILVVCRLRRVGHGRLEERFIIPPRFNELFVQLGKVVCKFTVSLQKGSC